MRQNIMKATFLPPLLLRPANPLLANEYRQKDRGILAAYCIWPKCL